MDILSQTLLSQILEYFLNNWKGELMIAVIVGFSIYFVMRYKYRYAIFYYENLLNKYSKKLEHIIKNLNELKQIVIQMNKEEEKKLLLEQIEKIINEKIPQSNKDNSK